MLNRAIGILSVCIMFFGLGCASSGKQASTIPQETMAAGGEELIWQSEKPRPEWTVQEPEFEGADMFFVGLSADMATEQLSRDDALRNSTKRVINYLGTLAKDKFEKMSTSFGLAGDVVNPSEVRNVYEKHVSAAAARNLKAARWYLEKWEKPTGIAWKSFVLAKIPKSSLDGSFKKAMDDQIRDARQKQKQTNDEIAKQQLEKAVEMMEKMKKAGISD